MSRQWCCTKSCWWPCPKSCKLPCPNSLSMVLSQLLSMTLSLLSMTLSQLLSSTLTQVLFMKLSQLLSTIFSRHVNDVVPILTMLPMMLSKLVKCCPNSCHWCCPNLSRTCPKSCHCQWQSQVMSTTLSCLVNDIIPSLIKVVLVLSITLSRVL